MGSGPKGGLSMVLSLYVFTRNYYISYTIWNYLLAIEVFAETFEEAITFMKKYIQTQANLKDVLSHIFNDLYEGSPCLKVYPIKKGVIGVE